MFYCGKDSSGPAGIYLLKISGHVVVGPGKFSDKVGSNLDFTLDHTLCMSVLLRTLSFNRDLKFKVLISGTVDREVVEYRKITRRSHHPPKPHFKQNSSVMISLNIIT